MATRANDSSDSRILTPNTLNDKAFTSETLSIHLGDPISGAEEKSVRTLRKLKTTSNFWQFRLVYFPTEGTKPRLINLGDQFQADFQRWRSDWKEPRC